MNTHLSAEVREELCAMKKAHCAALQRIEDQKDVAEMKVNVLAIVLGCVVGFVLLFTFYPV